MNLMRRGLAMAAMTLVIVCAGAEAKTEKEDRELVLSFGVLTTEKTLQRKQGDKTIPQEIKTNTKKKDVVLGKNYISIIDSAVEKTYLFDAKRILRKSNDRTTNCSLYSFVAFCDMEMRNRLLLRKALQSLKADTGIGKITDIDVETMFGIPLTDKQPTAVTTTETAKGTEEYSFEKQKLASFKAGKRLPYEYDKMFEKFLLYDCNLAPSVRKQIQSKHAMPAVLEYHANDPGFREVDVKLTLSRSTSRPSRGVPALTDEPCSAGIPVANKSLLPAKAETIAKIRECASKGNYLEGLLLVSDFDISDGGEVRELLKEMDKEKAKADPRAKIFFDLVSPKNSQQEIKDVLKAYEQVDRKGLEKAYVLDIYAANAYTALGEREKARQLFKTILTDHPYLTGAYSDAGKLYCDDYMMSEAWMCWDQARKLNPRHPLLNDIDALELSLSTQHPEFF